jgi:alcohol dehydrogenase
MRQLTFVGPGRLEWRQVAEPALDGDAAALVRPLAVATCDLDRGLLRGQVPLPGPFAFGHEFVAEVLQTGASVRAVTAGARVCVPFSISCGECDRCARGLTASCRTVPAGAMYGVPVRGDFGGALSDVVRVPYADAMLVPVPEGLPSEAVPSASDNLPDAWRTVVPPLRDRAGAEVLIVGGGAPSIGLYAVDIARAHGAGAVVYIDRDPQRLQTAHHLGADVVEGPPPRRQGSFPITVDASSRHDGLHCALRSTEPGGVCTSVGIYYGELTPMPLLDMYTRGITFTTSRPSARTDMPAILGAVAAGRIHPERVTSAVVSWSNAIDALLETPTKLVMVRDD